MERSGELIRLSRCSPSFGFSAEVLLSTPSIEFLADARISAPAIIVVNIGVPLYVGNKMSLEKQETKRQTKKNNKTVYYRSESTTSVTKSLDVKGVTVILKKKALRTQ